LLATALTTCAVRWHFRFQLSLRDIEESLPQLALSLAAAAVLQVRPPLMAALLNKSIFQPKGGRSGMIRG
jgi:hypothetical protein